MSNACRIRYDYLRTPHHLAEDKHRYQAHPKSARLNQALSISIPISDPWDTKFGQGVKLTGDFSDMSTL